MKYRTFFTTAVLSAVLALPALADDVDVASALENGTSGYNWTGVYAGINAGYGTSNAYANQHTTVLSDGRSFPNPLDILGDEPEGAMFGGHFGYNYQFDNGFVFGVEAEFSGVFGDDVKKFSNNQNCNEVSPNLSRLFSCGMEIDRTASITARAGYAFDRFLPYTEIGIGYIRATTALAADPATFGNATRQTNSSSTDDAFGLLLGAGVEYALTDNWTIKGEYNFSHYKFDANRFQPINGIRYLGDADVDLHTFKVGISYKF